MKNRRTITLILAALLALGLSACGGAEEGASDAVLTEAAAIAIQGLTQTAEARPSAAPTPTITPTSSPTVTFTPTATVEGGEPTADNSSQQNTNNNDNANAGAPCYKAAFEGDENIPDGTWFYVDELFTKRWRIKNVGSCTWDVGLNAIWVEGELMDADSVVAFITEPVPPNGYAELLITFEGPPEPGTYTSYWMLRASDGTIFGFGPYGKSWIWVTIETIPRE